ncbi:IDEAL domain-containing protein [Bacillus sp. KH172YL63]|uniref:IDEAL domain-containing protein n=1 Tax=Bacillus sp. KH172YL63 TaxID=2709784 RepID=UPI0013E4E388|nr:IDEAL domain-containing protein [Bacillus sp. KH172YL63]BCB03931.1 hypothetical protein KH172YL63_20640 [Bacillus sp. KH172YL63]
MKKYVLHSSQHDVGYMNSLFAEMVLDEALLTFRKEQLERQIDQALCNRDKAAFLRLTEEYNALRD